MPKYIIVDNCESRGGSLLRTVLFLAFFWLAALFWFGFFYYGSEPLNSEIQTEGRTAK